MVEGAALEKRCGVKPTESSNLFLSATLKYSPLDCILILMKSTDIKVLMRYTIPQPATTSVDYASM